MNEHYSSIYVHAGGEIVSTFDNPEAVKLGKCDLIEEIIIGEDKLLKFSGMNFLFYLLNPLSAKHNYNSFLSVSVAGYSLLLGTK